MATGNDTATDQEAAVRGAGRRELTFLLLLGAAGAGLVLLAARQPWAHIETAAPRPLPASVIPEQGQSLVPPAPALALAALAGLAAVLATRRMVRRVAAAVLAGLGVGIALAVTAPISPADVLAAASASAAQGGAGAGSTTAGTPGAAGSPLSGFPGHVVFAGFPWRDLAFAGALAVIASGVLVAWRAARLPVMSSRFDRGGRPAAAGPAAPEPAVLDSAMLWESLSRGEDPTGRPGG